MIVAAVLMSLLLCASAVAAEAHSSEARYVLPLVFERNLGQFQSSIDYVARTTGGTIVLHAGTAVIDTGTRNVRMSFRGARPDAPEALEPQHSISNYIRTGDASKWQTDIPHYGRIRYNDAYPGIDLVYYGAGSSLEYDLILAPHASPRIIQVQFDGADRIRTDAKGDLLIDAGGQVIRQLRPRAYQRMGGRKQHVAASYTISRDGSVRFALGRYDRSRELVIDPVIEYASYLGGAGHDSGVAVAVDAAGNAYITGETTSAELATSGAAQTMRAGDQDAFIAKLSPSGQLQFLTYLGGTKTDTPLGISVDASGNAYICGVTFSSNFPARNGAQMENGGGQFDSFIAKLNASGTRVEYATYLGGAGQEWANSIAVDGQGGAWVTGWTTSTDFPRQRAFQSGTAGGGQDVFVTRVAPSGQSFSYSTYFGGDGRDYSTAIAVDDRGLVYVAGATTSTALPFANAYQRQHAGLQDAFAFKLDTARNELVYSTLLGGSADDSASRIAADAAGNAYIVGYTKSPDFYVTTRVFQSHHAGGADLFATRLNASGMPEYSSYIGGSGDDWPGSIAIDSAGTMYIAGWTNSQNLPTRSPIQPQHQGGTGPATQGFDALVLRLSPNGDQLLYSTYLGGPGEDKAYGIGLHSSGAVALTGTTTSANFPGTRGAEKPDKESVDVFVARLSADQSVSLVGANPGSVVFTARAGQAELPPASVQLSSTGTPVTFSTGSSVTWLQVQPENGTTPATLTVTANPSGLALGTHTTELQVVSGANTLAIPVRVVVTLAPSITGVSPSALVQADTDATVSITGSGFNASSAVEVNGSRVASTLLDTRTLRAVIPSAFVRQPGTLEISVSNTDAESNTYELAVTSGNPSIAAAAIVNGATYISGAVSPGEIVVIGGSGFGGAALGQAIAVDGRYGPDLTGTRVIFDGVAAPILWAQSGLVAAVVPFSVADRATTSVVVEYQGRRSQPVSMPVAPASPGLFTANSAGSGQAAALNENGSFNSPARPAVRGSIIVLYGTGEGQISPAQPDGAVVSMESPPKPVLPVRVTIGGVEAEVLYAGSAPGQVAGLLQLNVRVPTGITPGSAVPVTVFLGTFSSPAGVTIAVE